MNLNRFSLPVVVAHFLLRFKLVRPEIIRHEMDYSRPATPLAAEKLRSLAIRIRNKVAKETIEKYMKRALFGRLDLKMINS